MTLPRGSGRPGGFVYRTELSHELRFGWLIPALVLAQAGSPAKDPRYMPITKADLISSIARTKRESSEHYILIDRAVYSDLGKVAYDDYSKISRSHPKDAMALLHAGYAGLKYWRIYMVTDMRKAERICGSLGPASRAHMR